MASVNGCRCPRCCPENPDYRLTEEFRMACEARHICRMPRKEDRQAYMADIARLRGEEHAALLRKTVLEEWEKMK